MNGLSDLNSVFEYKFNVPILVGYEYLIVKFAHNVLGISENVYNIKISGDAY